MLSWVWRQACSRASRGCEDAGTPVCDDGGPEGAGWVIFSRRVSGRPGAEGAPLDGRGRQMGICWRVEVLVVEVGWLAGGAMRRDCVFVSVIEGDWIGDLDGWLIDGRYEVEVDR